MKAAIDNGIEFEQKDLKITSPVCDFIERSIPGVDGVVSISAGARGRKILQDGLLRAGSMDILRGLMGQIDCLADGDLHVLKLQDGTTFDAMRIDSIKTISVRHDGRGVCWEFEISYTQARVG